MPTIPDLNIHSTQDQPPVLAGLHTPALNQAYLDATSNFSESIDHSLLSVIQKHLANHLGGGIEAGRWGENFPAEFMR